MKTLTRLSLTMAFAFATLFVNAQTPDAINYQAVARDAAGDIMMNQSINVTFIVHSGSAAGPIVYEEDNASTNTNQFGLFSLQVGQGTPVTGTLAGVDWSADSHWLEVEVNATSVGTQKISAVPYALLARDVENDNVDDADNDSTNELNTAAGLAGTDLNITDAGGTLTVDLSSLDDDTDADADPTNELQTLSQTGSTVTLSNGGGSVSVADNDSDPTNELQVPQRPW